jgi:hypothetical protein
VSQSEWLMVITAAGRSFYEAEHPRYRELYPQVEAPEPTRSRV